MKANARRDFGDRLQQDAAQTAKASIVKVSI